MSPLRPWGHHTARNDTGDVNIAGITPGIFRSLPRKNTQQLIHKIETGLILWMGRAYVFLGNQQKNARCDSALNGARSHFDVCVAWWVQCGQYCCCNGIFTFYFASLLIGCLVSMGPYKRQVSKSDPPTSAKCEKHDEMQFDLSWKQCFAGQPPTIEWCFVPPGGKSLFCVCDEFFFLMRCPNTKNVNLCCVFLHA